MHIASRVLALFLIASFVASPTTLFAEEVVRVIDFPVKGEYTFRNDFHEPRGGGTRLHIGTDIIAAKMTPLVAVVDGIINFVARPQVRWGYEVEIQDSEGYSYDYLHINNDTPGTDDGAGGEVHAYPSGIQRGATVSRGQVIGWVGDSGNAEDTVPHLHFEIRGPNHEIINPYFSLVAASGGKGVSQNAPRPTSVDVTFDERKAGLRYIFTKELSVGAESSEVRQLQMTLRALGHFTHPSDTGYFGEVTASAIRVYQNKKKIPETGKLDAKTRFELNADLGTYDPNVYIPFYSDKEAKAIELQRLLTLIAKLQAQLKALQGVR
jgi:murein DD-endopeptidase MepM/ murein hydrolase activator NlpD